MRRQKVVLLGPNGQLGYDILRAHEAAGSPFDLLPLARDALDVTAAGAVERTLGGLQFDVLVNCTAWTRVDEAEDRAGAAFAVNAHAVQTMARACAAKRARLCHIGTDYVFGGTPDPGHPLGEDAPIAPVNVYGASKALGETLARLATEDVTVLRVASLFGVAGASGKGGNFVETMIRAGRERGALRVVDDQTMSPTATADVAQVLLWMLARDCAPGLYHVINSGPATWFEFAREIVRRAGIDATVTPCASHEYPTRAARPRYCALDNAKVSAMFGPMPPWQDALERYLRARSDRGAGA